MILKYILVDVVPEFAGNEVLDNRSRAVETLQCTAHETCVAKVTETRGSRRHMDIWKDRERKEGGGRDYTNIGR